MVYPKPSGASNFSSGVNEYFKLRSFWKNNKLRMCTNELRRSLVN